MATTTPTNGQRPDTQVRTCFVCGEPLHTRDDAHYVWRGFSSVPPLDLVFVFIHDRCFPVLHEQVKRAMREDRAYAKSRGLSAPLKRVRSSTTA